jgi:hypothetical protein
MNPGVDTYIATTLACPLIFFSTTSCAHAVGIKRQTLFHRLRHLASNLPLSLRARNIDYKGTLDFPIGLSIEIICIFLTSRYFD